MADFTEGKNIISIKDIVKNHKVFIIGLLSAHAVSSCDTVPIYYRTGKKTAFIAAEKLFLGQEKATQDL